MILRIVHEEAFVFLSPDQLSERYGVPVATVYKWRKTGYGPRGMRVGRHVRYSVAECERWESEQTDQGHVA